jgi:DUF1365 family protein
VSTAITSAIYEGRVRHRRHAPRAHAFAYRMAQLYLDLGEVDALFRDRWLWSVDRPNLAEFRRSDFLGDPAQPLADAVRERVAIATGERPGGPVRLLSHLRYAGYSFNPVSFYYCHAADGALHSIVAEITNTPWKERHAYVLPVATADVRGRALHWAFDKAFHVSPFLPMAAALRVVVHRAGAGPPRAHGRVRWRAPRIRRRPSPSTAARWMAANSRACSGAIR